MAWPRRQQRCGAQSNTETLPELLAGFLCFLAEGRRFACKGWLAGFVSNDVGQLVDEAIRAIGGAERVDGEEHLPS